jgi:membrane protease YdiL (CAAX protease family)
VAAGNALLIVEFAVVFVGVPALLTTYRLPVPKILLLLAVAGACLTWLLRAPGFDRKVLWNTEGFRRGARGVLRLFAVTAPLLVAGVLVFDPESWLGLARRSPIIWLLVMVLYPLLSVYPQELIYRAFLFHRYRPLLRTEAMLTWASALSFAWMHIIYGNAVALLLSGCGGFLFATTYRRSGSLLLASFQHALYGCLIFTIGLGRHFYRGPAF